MPEIFRVSQRVFLIGDIYCSDRTRNLYGCLNDQVTLIAQHDNVWIVESERGDRFPVQEKFLSAELIQMKEEKKTESLSNMKAKQPGSRIKNVNPSTKQSNKQSNLF